MKLFITGPDIFERDAVGNHCFGIARIAERIGYKTELYAQNFDQLSELVRNTEDLFARVQPEDYLVVSYSIFDRYLDNLLSLPNRKLCYFHGVTDPELLRKFEPKTADLCYSALDQLESLKKFDIVIANSKHTADALSDYIDDKSIKIVPPVFADMPVFNQALATTQKNIGSKINLLVVGRVVPHKRIEDAITILADLASKGIDATLGVVGAMPNHEYSTYLHNHARDLDVLELVSFEGMIDQQRLFECYRCATALLSVSRHEGFCIPVLEAMHFGLPVIVRTGTAAIEVAKGAGIEFRNLVQAHKLIVHNFIEQEKFRELAKLGRNRAAEILKKTDDAFISSLQNL